MFSRKIFASRLKLLLAETNTTQQALADGIGMNRPNITQYCSKSKRPTIDNLIAIADYFDVSVDYLIGRTDNPESKTKNTLKLK